MPKFIIRCLDKKCGMVLELDSLLERSEVKKMLRGKGCYHERWATEAGL